ncbi:MAG: TonB-dependent receptor [Acidobacteria bacterium]|nr:TonB-dependent receptor [Acidobacteriota bacterium]
MTGTITDATGGVLPGVTVTAIHEATGNTFVSVTDGSGVYRIPARVGSYRVTAELSGFNTVNRSGLTLLVGQTANLDIQLTVSTLQESVTVTGAAPLLDVATSSVSGNIDARQMQDLPIQGRDWTSLALLAPGNRTTAMGGTPVQDRADVREYQLNLDGQQVTQTMGIDGQPLYSRDSIAEFQFISNRFDATQGRSSGVLVNAVTKSGTNAFSGLFSGTFRNSSWNADDHVLNREIPFSNQQVSTTFGGPIVRDKMHFFANFEYDRSPSTTIWDTPFPAFNISRDGTREKKLGGGRVDYQLSASTRLMGKVHRANDFIPMDFGANATGPSATQHPATFTSVDRTSNEYLGQLTQVVNNRTVNEVKVGFSEWSVDQMGLSSWSNHPQKRLGITQGVPRIRMVGMTILPTSNAPRVRDQNMLMLRDDFSVSYEARGRHDMRAGGEYLRMHEYTRNCRFCSGEIDARNGTIPAAVMQSIFPDPWNVDTWNLAALSPYTRSYLIGVSDTFETPFDMPRVAAWVQDDWRVSSNLTLNIGVRYDVTIDAWANDVALPPFLQGGRPDDRNNIQPRLGLAYQLNDRTVLRGGVGRYYGDVLSNMYMWTLGNTSIATTRITNDGRADFASNPFNGAIPSFQQAFAGFCSENGNRPGCLIRELQELAPPPDYAEMQNSWQTSVGIQRQLAADMAVEADYVYNGSRNEKVLMDNINLSYNQTTGVNAPSSQTAARPFPLFGVVSMTPYTGWSDYHGLQLSFTKRMASNWQGSATYTLGRLKNSLSNPISGTTMVSFPVAPDLGEDYTLAETDQRHRLVFNGIFQTNIGFQLSGVYFYGSGERMAPLYGGDLRGIGGDGGSQRLRPNGTIIPRNSFVGDPIHRVDVRLQQRIPVGSRVRIDGTVEVFNLFDRANFGSYVIDEASSAYGNPDQNLNIAYGPRALQLGFRVTF